MSLLTSSFRLAALLCLVQTSAHSIAAPAAFSYTDLGADKPDLNSAALGINNRGHIAGWQALSESLASTSSDSRGMIWINDSAYTNGVPNAPSDPGNIRSQFIDISDNGSIVGVGGQYNQEPYQVNIGLMWKDGIKTWFPSETGDFRTTGTLGVNEKGQAVGRMRILWNDASPVPFFWDGTTLHQLEHWRVYRGGGAADINNDGTIVGWNVPNAIVWKQGQRYILPTLFAGVSMFGDQANGVNDKGVVVGWSYSGPEADARSRAVVWLNGRVYELSSALDAPGRPAAARAYAINEQGLVVGTSAPTFFSNSGIQQPYEPTNGAFYGVATLWLDRYTALDLNMFLPAALREAGWILRDATDINEQGWIVGTAENKRLYKRHAYVLKPLTPLPTPAYLK